MALARAVRRRGRWPARGGPGLDAAAGVAHRRGDAPRAAPERPAMAAGSTGTEFLTTFRSDDGQLEEVLASMPLRVWRTDEVTPLAPHPNDRRWRPAAQVRSS